MGPYGPRTTGKSEAIRHQEHREPVYAETVRMEAFVVPRNKTKRYKREAEIWRQRYWELRTRAEAAALPIFLKIFL